MNVTLLVNPAARGGAHTGSATRAAERLRAHGVRTTILSGGSAAESSELLRTAIGLGTDAVAVAGGDGTVHLAIQELAGSGIPLGIIPAGTGNDLATALGLRELHPEAAADAISAGRTRRIDLARVIRDDGSTAYFGTVLASGFDSRVNDRANAMRWPRGGSRYNIAILIEFPTLAGIPYDVDLELPDGSRKRISGDLVMATVGNGATTAAASRSVRTPTRRRAAGCHRSCGRRVGRACCACCPASTRARTRACRRSRRYRVRIGAARRPRASRRTRTATRSDRCRSRSTRCRRH